MNEQKAVTYKQWPFISITIIMLAGLFLSRALLSVSSLLVLVVFILNKKNSYSIHYIVAGIALVILPVIISGLWSVNRHEWWRSVEIKIPLLTIAPGIAAANISLRIWRWISRALILFTTLATAWSVAQYFTNRATILQDYLRAKVMATPLDNDHIRFSWLVVLCILLSCYLLKKPVSKAPSASQAVNQSTNQQLLKAITIINILWLIFYLHLLSAKTGLLCLYTAAFLFLMHYIFVKKNRLLGIALLVAIIALPCIAYKTLPTFKNRLQYIQYDFSNYSKGNFIPWLSDGARVLSLQAGWHVTAHHPLTGVGFGDMKPAADQWHRQHHPGSLAYERFLPLNEWLYYGAGSGIPGIICFTTGLILLLSVLFVKQVINRIAVIVLLIPLITDDTLESQFGVFIFIFMLMWLWLHTKLNQPAIA